MVMKPALLNAGTFGCRFDEAANIHYYPFHLAEEHKTHPYDNTCKLTFEARRSLAANLKYTGDGGGEAEQERQRRSPAHFTRRAHATNLARQK